VGERRPNFILFINDQHRYDYLACNGHPVVRTPNIDAIAARGVSFDRFYVASPVCMPNRATLMTGRMPSVHGVRFNGTPLSRQAVTFVDLLAGAGYQTALVGKSHLQCFTGVEPTLKFPPVPEGFHAPSADLREAIRSPLYGAEYQEEVPGFWSQENPEMTLPFYGFQHVELVRGHGDGVGGHYEKWLLSREPNARALIGEKNQLPHDYSCPQAVRTALPPELYHTTYIGERAEAWLAEHARADEAPFFLMVSFPDPHHPFNPPGKYWDMYAPDQFPVPEAFIRNDWVPPPHVKGVWDEREAGAAQLKGMNTISVSAREAQEAQALTCGMITMIDDTIGRVLQALEASGQANETVLLFTTDHGDHLGDHRLMLKGAEMYQGIVHVPFIWADPSATEHGTRTGALATTMDISATILDRARVAPYVGLQGQSLLPAISGDPRAGRDAAFIQYDHQKEAPGLNIPPRVHTLIDGRYRITVFDGVSWGELYDLEADRGEFQNLWQDAAAASTKARLMEMLLRTEIAHMDTVPMPTNRA
jgi:arylsulfatase A-like enzyme